MDSHNNIKKTAKKIGSILSQKTGYELEQPDKTGIYQNSGSDLSGMACRKK